MVTATRKPSVPLSERAASVSRIRAGSSDVATEAKLRGVSQRAVRYWCERAAATPAPAPAVEPSRDGTSADGVQPGVTPALSRGEEAAAAADKVLNGSASTSRAGAAPGESAEILMPAMTPEALVAITADLVGTVTMLAAQAKHIPESPELYALAALTPEERVKLAAFAPQTVPYAERLLSKAPALGCCMFAFALVTITARRFGALKRLAPPAARRVKEAQPAPQSAATEDAQHAPAAPSAPPAALPSRGARRPSRAFVPALVPSPSES